MKHEFYNPNLLDKKELGELVLLAYEDLKNYHDGRNLKKYRVFYKDKFLEMKDYIKQKFNFTIELN